MEKDDITPTCGALGYMTNGDRVKCDKEESHGGRHRYTFPSYTDYWWGIEVQVNGKKVPSTVYTFWDQS